MSEICPICKKLQAPDWGMSCGLHTNPDASKYHCYCDGTGWDKDDEGNTLYETLPNETQDTHP